MGRFSDSGPGGGTYADMWLTPTVRPDPSSAEIAGRVRPLIRNGWADATLVRFEMTGEGTFQVTEVRCPHGVHHPVPSATSEEMSGALARFVSHVGFNATVGAYAVDPRTWVLGPDAPAAERAAQPTSNSHLQRAGCPNAVPSRPRRWKRHRRN